MFGTNVDTQCFGDAGKEKNVEGTLNIDLTSFRKCYEICVNNIRKFIYYIQLITYSWNSRWLALMPIHGPMVWHDRRKKYRTRNTYFIYFRTM